jgi:hypothetical protein
MIGPEDTPMNRDESATRNTNVLESHMTNDCNGLGDVILLSIWLLCMTLLACDRPIYRDVVQYFSDRAIGAITAGTTMEQNFVPDHNRVWGVSVLWRRSLG